MIAERARRPGASFGRTASKPGQPLVRASEPQIQLTREEIGDIAAYILTLKDK